MNTLSEIDEALFSAILQEDEAAVKAALAAGANPMVLHPTSMYSPLGYAVFCDVPMTIVNLLLEHGASVMGNPANDYLLQNAAENLNLPLVQLLLAHGVDVNAGREYDGATPLFALAEASASFYPYDGPIDETYLQMVETLLAAGADVSARAESGAFYEDPGDPDTPSVLEIATSSLVEYAEMLLGEYEEFCENTPPEFQRDVDAFSDRYYYLRAMERAYQLMVESPTNTEQANPLRTHRYYSVAFPHALFYLRHLLRSF